MTSPAPLIIKLACGLTVELRLSQFTGRIAAFLRLAPKPHQLGIGDILVSAWAATHCCYAETFACGDRWMLWVGETCIDLDSIEQGQLAERWIDARKAELAEAAGKAAA